MRAGDFGWVFCGVLLNAGAQLLLKAGASSVPPLGVGQSLSSATRAAAVLAVHPAIWAGVAAYIVSVIVWIVALSRVQVSVAYPMLSIGYVVNALLAWWLFDEAVSAQRWLGIGVILIGVALVARSGSGP
jgi:drug/metabolite transporter (DMT)-like permease